MKTILKILIIPLLVISSQNENVKNKNIFITFNLKKLPKISTKTLFDLGFSEIEYIPLETNEKCLIQKSINLDMPGDRLIIGNNFYLIKQFNSILKFRNNGSFIAKIGTVGRGPDEFQICHDLEIDEKGQIYIVDGFRKKFYTYSENGEFIKTTNIPLDGVIEFRLVEGMFLCYNENNLGKVKNSFILIDKNGKVVKSFPNIYPYTKTPNMGYTFQENLFYRFNNKLFKKEVYSDTIFMFEDMKFVAHLSIEVGDKLITPKVQSELAGMDIAKKYISPQNLFEFGDYIYYQFMYTFNFSSTLIYSFIGSKLDNSHFLLDTGQGLVNDLDGGPNILPLTIKDENTIISSVDAIKLKAHVASEAFRNSKPKYPEKKKELEKLANSLKETDNPVLIMVRLKK
jgi:hypothetical protein